MGALQAAQEIKQQAPGSAVPNKIAAVALASEGDSQGALKEVQSGLKLAPQDQDLISLQKLLSKKITDSSMASLQGKIKAFLNSDPAASFAGARGQAAADDSDVRMAGILDFSPRALRADYPRAAMTRAAAARSLAELNLGDPASAEKRLTREIQKDPSNWVAFRLRAMARRNGKNLAGAYDDASQALKLNGRDGWAYKIRAMVLMELGRYAEARADLERALALNPRDADAFRTRAMVNEKTGRVDDMLADLKEASDLDPAFEDAYRRALAEHPHSREAKRDWIISVARSPITKTLGLLSVLVPLFLFFRRKAFEQETAPMPDMRGIFGPLGTGIELLDNAARPGIGGFEIVRRIGQGGMGVVYEAFDRALQRQVALKRMRDEISGNRREAARFLKEAKTVASLSHENIVRIYSVLERQDGLFLIFEYVSGKTLDQVLARRRALPAVEALEILRQMSLALDYAHGRGVIHRDLKPANIMVADSGAVKVMDFGIARQVQESLSRLSREEAVGTPVYMAPEQELGRCHKESDVYALGVCLYEMLIGDAPFSGSHPMEQKMRKSFRPLSKVAAWIPPAADSVLAKALEPEPKKRYACAGEFFEAMRQALLPA